MRSERWALVLVLAVTLALGLRLLHLIDAHAVNLLYYDQLDLYEAFKGDASLWEIFRWQHGPHRQGLPFIGTRWIAELSHWNTRADAFYVASYVLAATVLALALRRRLLGPLGPTDVAVPLLLLTPAQYGIFIHTPNASHSAGPLFFLMLFCLALTLRDRRWRYGTLVALDFVMLHTGFALFVGAITPALLAISALRDFRARGRRALGLPAAGFALSLLWIAVFLHGYTNQGFEVVEPAPWYVVPPYVAYMFANVLGLKGGGLLSLGAGSAAVLAALGVALRQLARLTRPDDPPAAARLVVLTLTAFTFLYCVATACGRAHLGMSGSQSSRYVPLVAPAFLGLYLAVAGLPPRRLRTAALWVCVAALIAATVPMRENEARFMERLARGKRIWVETFLQTGDWRASNRTAGIRLYPHPDPSDRIEEKLDYLRRNHLNLFADG